MPVKKKVKKPAAKKAPAKTTVQKPAAVKTAAVKTAAVKAAPKGAVAYDEKTIKTLSSLEHIRLRTGMYIGRLATVPIRMTVFMFY